MKWTLTLLATCALALPVRAQDPVEVDPDHYALAFENDCVRVLQVRYGPGERSVMHEHPELVAVALTDGRFRFTPPEGEVVEAEIAAGEALWDNGTVHLPENAGSTPAELVLVELKPDRPTACERPQGAGAPGAGGASPAGGARAGAPQEAGAAPGCVGLGCGDSTPPCIGMGCPD